MDLDSFQVRATGFECTSGSLSDKYKATFDSSKLADCDDTDNQVWRSVVAYGDADSDSYGTGAGDSYCIGTKLSSNLSINSTDCDDDNSDIFESLSYSAIDEDLDTYQLSLAGTECTNGNLSEIYQSSFDNSKLPDCNDSNTQTWRNVVIFPDVDGDSFGDMESDGALTCIGELAPINTVFNATDCKDDDVNVWRNDLAFFDNDGDSVGAGSQQTYCIGINAAEGSSYDGTDCNDNNINIWRAVLAYDDIDGDGFGSGPQLTFCTNAQAAPDTSYKSYDCDDNDISVFRKITIYPDTDGDGIGAGQGSITCMGNSYLEGSVSIYGYDPEPDNAEVSNFDLPVATLVAP